MNGPDLPARRSFFTGTHAAEHLCDHALTRPEAHDWAGVLPGYGSLVVATDDTALRRVAASLFSGPPCPEAEALRDLYVGVILQNIEDALRLGFWWEQCQGKYQEWFGLGLDGVYIIWDREVIKTGYFPGSSTFPPAGAPRPRSENPLPRRDLAKQLRPPSPDSLRHRFDLFQNGFYCFNRDYAIVCEKDEVTQEGGGPFVNCHLPRMGRWQQWCSERPGRKPSS